MGTLSAFETLFLIAILFYVVQQIIFLIGFNKKIKTNLNYEPKVTVIVAARNEEENIRNCLDSLVKLDYPEEKLEIIMVDDYSTDNTGKIIDEYSQKFSFIKKVIPSEKVIPKPGKTNALVNGIRNSKGEIIFTTDADCIVKSSWIKTQLKYFTDNVGVVTGFTYQNAYSQFTGMQNLDWVYLLTVAAGTINLGLPLSCIGNNMAYRRDAYNWVGGYENIKFSVTEDFALLHKIHKHTNYKIVFPVDPDGINRSEPCTDLKTLYRQKHRCGIGGLDAPFIGFVIMFWGWLSHLMILLQIFFMTNFTLLLTLIKLMSDFVFLFVPLKKFKMVNQLKYFISFQIYFILYVLILPFIVFINRKVIWKEREY